jgi:hypothetical protein
MSLMYFQDLIKGMFNALSPDKNACGCYIMTYLKAHGIFVALLSHKIAQSS